MAGYTVGVASETKAFKQGIDSGVIEPLEDAQKELLELGRNRGPEQLERSLRDAQDETEKLADETKATARVIEREYKDSYRDMKRSSDDATDAAKKGMDEVGDEAASTAKESAASFDGSAESIVDAFQEVAANAFAGFGPAGLVAGLAAAAGIGAAMSAITAQQDAVDELKQKFSDAYKQAAEDGRTFLDEAAIQSLAIDIYFDPAKREEARKDAEELGVDLQTAVRAQAGDQDALVAIIEAGNRKIAEGTERMKEKAAAGKNVVDFQTAETAGLEGLTNKYRDILGIQKENEQAAREVKQLQNDMGREAVENQQRAQAADQARWEAMAERYSRPLVAKVDIQVDDSAYRNWRPTPKTVDLRVKPRGTAEWQ